jgi:hypothetical protein
MASFPSSLVTYTAHADFTEVILAAHVNSLQDEMTAVQTTLGYGANSLLTSTWSGTPSEVTTSWTNLSDRIRNIEIGLKSYGGFAPHPFLLAGM